MHYTVAIIEDIQGNVKVNFDKTGNKFVVGLYNKKTKEYTAKIFNDTESGYLIFEKLSRAIIDGCYNYEDRKEMLK